MPGVRVRHRKPPERYGQRKRSIKSVSAIRRGECFRERRVGAGWPRTRVASTSARGVLPRRALCNRKATVRIDLGNRILDNPIRKKFFKISYTFQGREPPMPLSFELLRLDNAHLLADPVEHPRTVELANARALELGLVQLPQPVLALAASKSLWDRGRPDSDLTVWWHLLRLRCLCRNGGSVSAAVRSGGRPV